MSFTRKVKRAQAKQAGKRTNQGKGSTGHFKGPARSPTIPEARRAARAAQRELLKGKT